MGKQLSSFIPPIYIHVPTYIHTYTPTHPPTHLPTYSPELVDVAAIVKVRDDVLQRKGRFLELVMEDLLSALYLRLAGSTTQRQGR